MKNIPLTLWPTSITAGDDAVAQTLVVPFAEIIDNRRIGQRQLSATDGVHCHGLARQLKSGQLAQHLM